MCPNSIGGSTYVTPGNLGQGSDSEHYLMTQAGRLLKRHSSWAGMLAGPKAPLGLAPPSSFVSCQIIIVVVVETQREMEMNEMERFYIGQAGTRTGVHDMSCRGVPSTMTTTLLLLNKSNWSGTATDVQFHRFERQHGCPNNAVR